MASTSHRARAQRFARWLSLCLGLGVLLTTVAPASVAARPANQDLGPLPEPVDSCSSTSDLPPLDLDPLGPDPSADGLYYAPPPPAPVCIPPLPPPPIWPTSPAGLDLVEPVPAPPEPLLPPEPALLPEPEPDPVPPFEDEPSPEPAGADLELPSPRLPAGPSVNGGPAESGRLGARKGVRP